MSALKYFHISFILSSSSSKQSRKTQSIAPKYRSHTHTLSHDMSQDYNTYRLLLENWHALKMWHSTIVVKMLLVQSPNICSKLLHARSSAINRSISSRSDVFVKFVLLLLLLLLVLFVDAFVVLGGLCNGLFFLAFHSSFSISRAIPNDGIVLPIYLTASGIVILLFVHLLEPVIYDCHN